MPDDAQYASPPTAPPRPRPPVTGILLHPGIKRNDWSKIGLNAKRLRCPPSLIGRFGSSTFRLSAAAVSMSLTGSVLLIRSAIFCRALQVRS